jgi:hypothetical protein
MDMTTKLQLHDGATSLAGLRRKMVMVIDEMENYIKIDDPEIQNNINEIKILLDQLDGANKKLYNKIVYTEVIEGESE